MRFGPRTRYAIVSVLGYAAFALVAFAGSVLVARLLGPDGKGEYTAWTLGTTTAAYVLLGSVPTGLGRGYLQSERSALLPAALRHGVLAFGIVGVGVLPALLLGVDPVPLLACLLVAVPPTIVVLDLIVVMQAAKRPWPAHGVRVLSAATFTAGMAVVTVTGISDPLNAAFALWAVGASLSAVAATLVIYRRMGARAGPGIPHFGRLGARSYVGTLLEWLINRIDQFFVVGITGSFGLGLYSVAVNWSEACLYLGNAIAQSVFEDRRTLDQHAARRILFRSLRILGAASTVIILAGFGLIGPVFGDQFSDARWALLLLGPGVVARGLALTGSQILLARGEGWKVSQIMTMTFGVAVLAYAGLTWLFGIEGAAAAASGAYLLQMGLTLRALFGPGRPSPRREEARARVS